MGSSMEKFVGQLTSWQFLTPIVIALALLFGLYAFHMWRTKFAKKRSPASELITNFRRIYSRGGLSDAEYRNIKSQLARRLRAELKESDPKR
jgi:hypothetical protein